MGGYQRTSETFRGRGHAHYLGCGDGFTGGDMRPLLARFHIKKTFYLFIWLNQVLVAAHRIVGCGMQVLRCGM